MLNELRRITSTDPYKYSGAMRVKEIVIQPWLDSGARFILEIFVDDVKGDSSEIWELTCNNLAPTDSIPQFVIPRTALKLLDDHPVLLNFSDQVYFSITSRPSNITSLIGEIFIEHTKSCGNWVDFHRLYAGLPETLYTLRENQLAVPAQLTKSFFGVLDKYLVKYQINSIQKSESNYKVLFFSKADTWPDEENFGQSYIVAENFTERRLS